MAYLAARGPQPRLTRELVQVAALAAVPLGVARRLLLERRHRRSLRRALPLLRCARLLLLLLLLLLHAAGELLVVLNLVRQIVELRHRRV